MDDRNIIINANIVPMNIEEVRELGLPRVGGCICSDGAFEAHTAALFEPYADEPENYGTVESTRDDHPEAKP